MSRGMIGNTGEIPKVACPLHKKTFSLETGECISGDEYDILTFPVKVEDGEVFVELPPTEELDQILATEIGCEQSTCQTAPEFSV